MPISFSTTISNRPKMTVEVDFVNDPTSVTETWTDITKYVRGKGDPQLLSCDRGRNYELARTEAGTFTLLLDNTDGRFDPANLASPYVTGTANPGGAAGLVTTMRRIRIRASWDGTTYNVWRGYVEDWPQEWDDGGTYGRATLTGSDAISVLSAVDLQAMPVTQVLLDNPIAFYRCNDPSGSTSAANSSTTNQPNSQIVAGSSAQTTDNFAFGSTQGTGTLAGDPTSSLAFTATWSGFQNASGYALRTTDLGQGPALTLAGGCSLEMWLATSNNTHNANSTLFVQYDSNDNTVSSSQQLEVYLSAVTGGYAVNAALRGTTGANINAIGTVNVTDGSWHHVAVTISTDAKTLKVYIDGVQDATATGGTAAVWNAALLNEWAGDTRPAYPTGVDYFDGVIKNLGLYNSTLSAARILAHFQSGNCFTGEPSGTRIGRLLDAAGWPSALRTVATGDSAVGTQLTENVKTSEALQQVVDTERGALFIAGDGKVTFTNRQGRYNGAAAATFGEQAGENHYVEGLQIQRDPKDVYNDVSANRTDSITIRAIDTASQKRYFPRSLSVATIAVNDVSVLYLAEYLIARYKDPVTRIPQLVLEPSADPSLWPQALGREIGDRITVNRRPGGATASSADYFIEHINHAVTGTSWKTTWLLSPASIDSYFELDSQTYGHLADVPGTYTLNANINSSVTSLTLLFASGSATWTTTPGDWPLTILVDAEQMSVTAVAAAGGTTQVLTVTRGVNGTSAAAHTAGAVVTLVNTYALTL